jgi:hypothetical protein
MRTALLGTLYLIGLAGFALGALAIANAASTWQATEAWLCFLIGTVGLGFAAVVQTLEAVRDEIEVSTRMKGGK